jgi:hypothetical protein
MKTKVTISVDYSLQGDKVNLIHSTIGLDQLQIKVLNTLNSTATQVIPQYEAAELNLTKRAEAEERITNILQKEYPSFYVNCARVRLTDIEINKQIADAAAQTAAQMELNKLAGSKADGAKKNYEAAEWDAKTKAILSQPAMLAMKKLDVEMEWAKKGVSPYGNNNVFGSSSGMILNRN